jgi:hypothetical protein
MITLPAFIAFVIIRAFPFFRFVEQQKDNLISNNVPDILALCVTNCTPYLAGPM